MADREAMIMSDEKGGESTRTPVGIFRRGKLAHVSKFDNAQILRQNTIRSDSLADELYLANMIDEDAITPLAL